MALGATRRDVLMMIHKSALAMAGAGVALGAPLALAAQRVAVTFVDNMAAGTAAPIAIAPPRRSRSRCSRRPFRDRAARISPLDALRAE